MCAIEFTCNRRFIYFKKKCWLLPPVQFAFLTFSSYLMTSHQDAYAILPDS